MKKLILFCLFTLSVSVYAQTNVSGTIQSDTTWNTTGGVVRIVGDVIIPDGVTLTIDPGVTIHYADSVRIQVQGTMNAIGTVTDSIIFEHETPGMSHYSIDFDDGVGTMRYCRIQDGTAPDDGSYGGFPYSNRGGAILIRSYSTEIINPSIEHCLIKNNYAATAGGIYVLGSFAVPVIESCVIRNNIGYSSGGGIAAHGGATLTLRNSIVAKNRTNHPTNGAGGGISFHRDVVGNLTNNIFYGNSANNLGGGGLHISNYGNSITVKNCIFWDNTATGGADEIEPGIYSDSITVEYSDIEGGYTGTGNINQYPAFTDSANLDFHFAANSPLVDAGTNTGAPSDDFDGNTRPFDGNRDGTATVDIGPYEYINTTPQITSTPVTSTLEDDLYNYQVTAQDPDSGEVLTYSLSVAPTWLSINSSSGLISGTPLNENVGDTTVTVQVADLNNSTDTQTFTLTVQNVNDAPTISNIPNQTTSEDTATGDIAFTVNDVDNDPASLTLSATSTNTSLVPVDSIFFGGSGTNRTVNISPVADQNGTSTITVTVNDGELTGNDAFILTVTSVNDGPIVSDIPNQTIDEGGSFTAINLDNYVDDVDHLDSQISWGYSGNVDLTVNINPATRVAVITIPNTNWNGNETITFTATDPGLLTDNDDATFTVNPVNDPPVITSTAVTSATEDVLYEYQVVAEDVDVGDVLTYSLSVAPTWLSINSSTGLISGTPLNANVGDTTVTVVVDDGQARKASVEQTYTLTVANTNDPPVITSTALTSATEDVLYEYQVVAEDVDVGDVLTYSLSVSPTWLSINSSTGLISGTPTNDDVGDTTVTVVVDDGQARKASVEQTYTLTVANTNDPPVITSTALTSATEDVLYEYQVVAEDVDVGDVLTYSLSVSPSWLSINTATGLISGTPTNDDVGDTTVTVVVDDGQARKASVEQTYTLTVANTNDPPVITSTAVTSATEDVLYEYQVVAEDVDVGDVLTYSLSVSPTWLSINSGTGLISGTPTNANVGDTTVTVVVDDGQARKASVEQTYTLTVANTNDPPVITSTAVTSATEDVLYEYQVVAEDVDVGDVLTYSLSVAPSWLSINSSTGLISGTPTNANVGDTTVTVVVDDGQSRKASVEQTYTLTVANTNDPPVITSTAVTSATEDVLYEYQVVAEDVDVGDVLSYSLSVAPTWLSINSSTGLISGTPTNANVGDTTVTVVVDDGQSRKASVEQTYTLTVANTNDPPVITSTAVTSATEDVLYEYQVVAEDVDVGDVLTYSLSVAPTWLSINSGTGLISGTPTNANVGDTTVTVVVDDGQSRKASVEQTYTLTVANTNDPPVITSTAVTSATEDVLYEYQVVAEDVDVGDVLTYSLSVSPTWLSINSGTGLISGTPTNANVGDTTVTVVVDDGQSRKASVEQTYTLTVANTNDPPVITSTAVTSATEDVLYEYQVVAEDVDVGDVLTYSLSVAPSWLSINSSTGLISGTPTNANVGDTTVTVVVDDGQSRKASVEQIYTLTVANTNDPPVITSTAVTSATEDVLYEYQVVAEDVDVGDVLSYSLSVSPTWLSINSGTGLISGTPTNANVGDTTVTVVVDDGQSRKASVEQTYTLTVANTNDPPVITSTAVTSATEDVLYEYQVVAEDVDVGDVLSYSLSVAPTWLSINSGTGLISGTPTNANVGDTTVTVVVDDGQARKASVEQTYTLTVANTNDPPVITSAPLTGAVQDQLYQYQVVATDPDVGDILTYSLSVAPTWLSINSGTGLISGTPTNANVGDTTVTVVVDDGQSRKATVSQTYTLTVSNTNDPPTITSTPVTAATEDLLYEYQVTATDPDPGTVFIFSLSVNPSWLSINSSTGLVSGTPSNDDVGDTTVTVVVSDGVGSEAIDTQTYTLTVANVNDPPVITSTAVTTATEDLLYEYQVVATDPDVGDVLSYSLSVSPTWLSINSSTGLISGTPTNANVGDTTVTVVVDDGQSRKASVEQTYTLTVANTNDPPVITSAAVTSATEDVLYEYQVVAEDVDVGDVLTYSLSVAPSWLSINSSTGLISGTPLNANVGDTTVTVVVDDGQARKASVSQTYTLTVANVNDPPVISQLPQLAFNEDDSLLYSISELYTYVDDPDHPDSLLVPVLSAGSHVTVTASPPNIILSAPENWFGTDTLELVVLDPEFASDTAEVFVTVNPINDAPVFVNWPDMVQFTDLSDTVLTMIDYVNDIDSPDTSLVWQISVENDSLNWQFNSETTELTLSAPGFNGMITLYCTVTDDSMASVQDSFVVKVIADPTGIEDLVNNIPEKYFINQNYPNPFNPVTKIKYGLPKSDNVRIEIYNIIGQKVLTILNEFKNAGYHTIDFDGSNIPSGVYFYQIRTKEFNNVKKMVLIK